MGPFMAQLSVPSSRLSQSVLCTHDSPLLLWTQFQILRRCQGPESGSGRQRPGHADLFPLFSHCSRCSWPSESHLGQVNLTPMYTSVVSCSDVVVNMAPPCSPFCSFSWCVCSFNKLLIPLQGRGASALRGSLRDLPVAVYRTHPPNSCIGTRPSITC